MSGAGTGAPRTARIRQEAKDTADVLRWYIRARTARLLQKRNLHEKGR